MGTLTIRNVDAETHARLRLRAARNGRSVEAEVRHILDEMADLPEQNFLVALQRHVGGKGVELPIPPRNDPARSADLP